MVHFDMEGAAWYQLISQTRGNSASLAKVPPPFFWDYPHRLRSAMHPNTRIWWPATSHTPNPPCRPWRPANHENRTCWAQPSRVRSQAEGDPQQRGALTFCTQASLPPEYLLYTFTTTGSFLAINTGIRCTFPSIPSHIAGAHGWDKLSKTEYYGT